VKYQIGKKTEKTEAREEKHETSRKAQRFFKGIKTNKKVCGIMKGD